MKYVQDIFQMGILYSTLLIDRKMLDNIPFFTKAELIYTMTVCNCDAA